MQVPPLDVVFLSEDLCARLCLRIGGRDMHGAFFVELHTRDFTPVEEGIFVLLLPEDELAFSLVSLNLLYSLFS